ncbi:MULTISPECIES: hypothetical protein [Catenuloplanes]|uniref:Uncharacterized protein n=1 Tax=Catenuloplanes niger TaxID=587534 RepID=A0AAE3ZVS7_9ACTN|nr:hypothetical protein [Catenuloplanes niger]MDR7326913.1 hypothetical protein [Catenuloplanes niger]
MQIRTGLTAVVVLAVVVLPAAPARADTTANGTGGQRLTVSKSEQLSRAGETVTVSGRGYDDTKGIYVAFCVDNGAGALPTPCGGGADTSGSSGASIWISSNPPSYAEGLTTPYGSGGSFSASIRVTPTIGAVDCTVRACSVVTRNDHTRTQDRSQDVRIPVTFASGGTNGSGGSDGGGSNGGGANGGGTTGGGNAPAGGTGDAAGGAGNTGTAAGGGPGGAGVPAPGGSATPGRTFAAPAATAQATASLPPAPGEPAAMAGRATPLNRVSAATPLGHWWGIGAAFLAGIAIAVVAGRLRRRGNRTGTTT